MRSVNGWKRCSLGRAGHPAAATARTLRVCGQRLQARGIVSVPEPPAEPWVLACSDEAALVRAGRTLAGLLAAGDTLLLLGSLGAGKTTLARGIVQALHGDVGGTMRVTSPSYLLCNVYNIPATATSVDAGAGAGAELQVQHMDLYRLPTGGDVSFLDVPAVFSAGSAVCLVEWPQRLAAADRPERYLEVEIAITAAAATVGAVGAATQAKRRIGSVDDGDVVDSDSDDEWEDEWEEEQQEREVRLRVGGSGEPDSKWARLLPALAAEF